MQQVAQYPSRLQIKLQYGALWAAVIVAGGLVVAGFYVANIAREIADWLIR